MIIRYSDPYGVKEAFKSSLRQHVEASDEVGSLSIRAIGDKDEAESLF